MNHEKFLENFKVEGKYLIKGLIPSACQPSLFMSERSYLDTCFEAHYSLQAMACKYPVEG